MAKQHAWELDGDVDEEGAVTAYEQVVELAGSLLDMLNHIGGKFTVAAKRYDTGEAVAGIKVFETRGFVVVFEDHVPGVPAPEPDPGLAPDVPAEVE